MNTKVKESLTCPKCGARWTLTGGKGLSETLCPCCGEVGVPPRSRHVDASESQELPSIPQEQNYIRYITRKYIEVVEAFRRSLDDQNRQFVLSTTDTTIASIRSFESFLEKAGLPLEIPIMEEENLIGEVGRHLDESLSGAKAARDAFLKLFGSEEALRAIRERYGRG